MEDALKEIMDALTSQIATKILGQINTEVEKKEYPDNMDLATAAKYLNLNSAHMRRNLDEYGIRYSRAGEKYLFRKVWLDEWMEKGAEQIRKNKDRSNVSVTSARSRGNF